MAKVTVEYGALIVEIEGIDMLWALRSQLEIPLAHVHGAALAGVCATNPAIRGEAVPVSGAVSGGAFMQCGDAIFWDVREPTRAVVIALADDRYAQLVVEVDDPVTAVARINRAIADWQPQGNGDER